MTDEQSQQETQKRPDVTRPEEAVKDLEVPAETAAQVAGGIANDTQPPPPPVL